MARVRSSVERAAALHRQAVATADAAARVLDEMTPDESPPAIDATQRSLAATLTGLAADVAPGWLSVPWDATAASPPVGTEAGSELAVRVGVASPLPDVHFPVLVPLLGVGHLAIDAAPHDPAAIGLMRSVVLRLLAAATPGTLRVRGIDPTGVAFAPFQSLFDGRLMPPPAAELGGMRTLLAEAEQWVRTPAPAGRHLLFVIAGLPTGAEPSDVARVNALAAAAPAARLTMIVTGLPPARDAAVRAARRRRHGAGGQRDHDRRTRRRGDRRRPVRLRWRAQLAGRTRRRPAAPPARRGLRDRGRAGAHRRHVADDRPVARARPGRRVRPRAWRPRLASPAMRRCRCGWPTSPRIG